MIYDSIVDTIGRTPVVRIHRLAPAHVTMYVKVEMFNPGGSVKDRLAVALIEDGERRGALTPGQTVIEATSGNTGIALAMVCAARGYPFIAVMSEKASIERRQIMRGFGAKVVLRPETERGDETMHWTEAVAKQRGWFFAGQFVNPANPAYHRQTTGPEILQDFAGKRLDYFVTGWGTGGTLTGTGQILRRARPDTKIIACQPIEAQLLCGQEFNAHALQGWTPNFVPDVLDRDVFHDTVAITAVDAVATARALAHKEGIFVGITAGATFWGALEVAKSAPANSVLLAMLPDTGERYLSTILFDGVNRGSDEID